jgi:hypothetical protein
MALYEDTLSFCAYIGISVQTEAQKDILKRACEGDFLSLIRLPKVVQDYIRL